MHGMANPEHVEILEQGVDAWNSWRQAYPDIRPDLSGASLQMADLSHVDFSHVDFREADLSGAKLMGATLRNTSMAHADLRDADLRETVGLTAKQLAGADISGAKLPDDLATLDGLRRVEESAKLTHTLFISVVLGCMYCWLTIGTTTDAALISNSGSARLPFLGTDIQIRPFHLVAPWLLAAMYLYFLNYLEQVWDALAKLPAVSVNGDGLHEIVYPWLSTSLICSHFFRLRNKCPRFHHVRVIMFTVTIWSLVPLTIVWLWADYLKAHDVHGYVYQIIPLFAVLVFGWDHYRSTRSTLRMIEFKSRSLWSPVVWSLVILILLALTRFLTTYSVNPKLISDREDMREFSLVTFLSKEEAQKYMKEQGPLVSSLGWGDPRVAVPLVLSFLGSSPFADLSDSDLSKRPPTWMMPPPPPLDSQMSPADGEQSYQQFIAWELQKYKERYALVSGANLKGTSALRWASAHGAFLANANFRNFDLTGADLSHADLSLAKLSGALLSKADLSNARLVGTELKDARMDGAILMLANLNGAELQGARCELTIFNTTELAGANLKSASLKKAVLRRADLRGAMLVNTNLSDAYFKEAKLHGADLSGANIVELTCRKLRVLRRSRSTKRAVTVEPSFLRDSRGLHHGCEINRPFGQDFR